MVEPQINANEHRFDCGAGLAMVGLKGKEGKKEKRIVRCAYNGSTQRRGEWESTDLIAALGLQWLNRKVTERRSGTKILRRNDDKKLCISLR